MSAQDRAAELLADLEGRANDAIEAIRARSTEIKSRLEEGMLNLQAQGSSAPVVHAAEPIADLDWDLDAAAAATPAQPEVEEMPGEDFRITAPAPVSSFQDELDVATDELGIPLGD